MDSRRNSTRRVSFATTAHVRLFEKEDQVDNTEEQELQKTLQMFHPENKKFNSLTSLFDMSTDSHSSYDVSLTGSPNMFREKLQLMNQQPDVKQTTPRSSKLAVFSSATPILDACIESKRNTPTPMKNLVLELNDKENESPKSVTIRDNSPLKKKEQNGDESMDMMSPIAQVKDSSLFMEMESPSYPKFSSRNSLSGIAPYLKSTPRSATSLRHSFFPDQESPSVMQSPLGQQSSAKSPKQSPALSVKNSIADFFALESPPALEPLKIVKARDSIAPLFKGLQHCDSDNDTDATIGRRIELEKQQAIGGMKSRPSIAPFFNGLDGCDSAEESFQLDCSASVIMESTPKKSYSGRNSKRNSLAPFFQGMEDTTTDSSFNEGDLIDSHPESLDIEQDVDEFKAKIEKKETFEQKRKNRTSIAHFFAEESEGESMLLDESRDLTNHDKFAEQDSVSNQNYFSTQETVTPASTQESNGSQKLLERSGSEESTGSQKLLARSSSGESNESNPSFGPKITESSPDSSELDISNLIELDSQTATPVKANFLLRQESPTVAKDADTSITPRRSSRAPVSPKVSARKPTPRKLLAKTPDLKKSAVTPMRRALAQKALAATAELESAKAPKAFSPNHKQAVSNPTSPKLKAPTSKQSSPRILSQKLKEKEIKSDPSSPRRSKRSTLLLSESPIKKAKFGDIKLESNVVAKQQVKAQPLEAEQSPLVEKEPSQNDEQSDIDLMDETFMSIMDTSIVLEKSQDENNNTQDEFDEILNPQIIEIKDLDQFLEASGISFKPMVEFSENTRQLPTDPNNIYDRMILEIENIYGEFYQHGCSELSTILLDLQAAITGFHEDIEESRPLFFDDYAQGTSIERDTISTNLKISKEFCYYEVKSDWLNWKKMLLERLIQNLENYESRLMDYNLQIEPINEQFRRVVKDSQDYLDDLVKNIELVEQEYYFLIETRIDPFKLIMKS